MLLSWHDQPSSPERVAALMQDFLKGQASLRFEWHAGDAAVAIQSRRVRMEDGKLADSRAVALVSPSFGGADMSTLGDRSPLILKLGTAIAAALLCASIARAQPPAESGPHAAASASASRRGAGPLMRRDLIGVPGKEVVMSTIEVPPGGSSPPHRHYAQVFVYMLQGRMIMQVKGGPRVTIGPGQTFYESPSDIHTVGANASKTEPAKFVAILIKDKGKPATVMMTPHKAH